MEDIWGGAEVLGWLFHHLSKLMLQISQCYRLPRATYLSTTLLGPIGHNIFRLENFENVCTLVALRILTSRLEYLAVCSKYLIWSGNNT